MYDTPWLDPRVPDGFWCDAGNRRRYMQWLGARCGYRDPDDWYRVTKRHFHENRGGGLLVNYYRDSPSAAVREHLPDHDWKPWLFRSVSQHFWQSRHNRRKYMDWLGEQLGYKRTSDWYDVTKQSFYDNRGGGMLANHFKDSPQAALREYRPRYDWKPWLFKSVTQGYWQRAENRRAYMEWLARERRFRRAPDWYRVTRQDFIETGGAGMLVGYYDDSPVEALREFRPDYAWDPRRFVGLRA